MRVQADTERDGSARELLRSGVCGLYRDGGVSPVTWGHGRKRRLLRRPGMAENSESESPSRHDARPQHEAPSVSPVL